MASSVCLSLPQRTLYTPHTTPLFPTFLAPRRAAPRANSFVSCETCGSSEVNGGFRPDEGVVLCTEHMHSQADVDAVLTHELVHAYDQCRAKNIDWCNCDHHACSEVRSPR